MVGSERMSSDPEDYKRAFWSRRQLQKFRKARTGVFQGYSIPLPTEETEPKKQNPAPMERSSTELRFASFPRSIVRDPGRLSRVEMNALRAPLTASQDLKVTCANFLLDGADDFIDDCHNLFCLGFRIAVMQDLDPPSVGERRKIRR